MVNFCCSKTPKRENNLAVLFKELGLKDFMNMKVGQGCHAGTQRNNAFDYTNS